MIRVALVVLLVVAGGEALFIGLHKPRASSEQTTLEAQRRLMCATLKSELAVVRSLPGTPGSAVSGERAMGILSSIAVPPVINGCGGNYQAIADDMQRATDCYIKNADAACIAEVATKVASTLPD